MKANQRSQYMEYFTYFRTDAFSIQVESILMSIGFLSSFTGLPLLSNGTKTNITELQNAMMPNLGNGNYNFSHLPEGHA
jgi:hypothetical protein